MKKLLLLLFISISLYSQATSYTWVGTTSTDWGTSTNWSPAGVPTTGDNITLGSGSGNQPVLDANRSIANITITARTLDLNGYTLTVTGTTTLTGGTINNGLISFSNTTTTFGGTTFGAKVTAAVSNISFNGSKFNKKVAISKSGGSGNTSTGGNVFNDTLDVSLSAGLIFMNYTNSDSLKGPVFLSSTGTSQGILFGENAGNAYLSSGQTIAVGSGGFSIGTLSFKRFTQNGSTPQTLSLTSTASINFLTSSTWNGKLTVTAPNIAFSGSTFNSKVTATKNGGSTNTSVGGNTFNDTLDFSISSSFMYLTYSNNDAFNGPVYISSTGTSQGIAFGENGGNATLASGKTIKEGSGGVSIGTISFKRFTQTGSTPQAFNFSGTAIITFLTNSTWNGKLAITAPGINFSGSTFSSKVTAVKTGNTQSTCQGGNTFNDTLDISLSSGFIYMAYTNADSYNGNVLLTSTGTSQGVSFGANGGTSTLASGKIVSAGSGGFSAGTLTFKNFTQSGSTAQTLTLSSSATLTFSTSSYWNGPITISTPNILFSGSTFNNKVNITKTGGSNNACVGGNTFNDSLIINNSSGSFIYMTYTNNDAFNGHIVINNTGTAQGVVFGENGGLSTLASGKKITIGSAGFTSGTLYLKRFTQNGSTTQSLTLTNGTTVSISNSCTFNGALTISSPNILIMGTTFNADLTITKTGTGSNIWSGANTYNGNVSVTNTGTGYINLSNVASGGDVFNSNATFTKSSSGDLLLAGNASTVTFKGNLTLSGISTAQFTSGQSALFAGTAAQTLTSSTAITFGSTTINKATDNLTLNAALNIATALTLTSGKIISTATYLLNFNDNATVSSASNSSYVQGPVAKTGNDAFTFPTGKGGNYRPMGISTPVSGSSTATIYTAEYLNANQTLGSTLQSPITTISNCEYWTFTRSGSSATVAVTLNWGSVSCNNANPSVMRVASWSGSQWSDAGNASNTGTNSTGSVTSSTVSTFNAFTLGNTCTLSAAISATPTTTTNMCPGTSVTLTANSGSYTYLWNDGGSTTQSISPTTANTYIVNVTDANNCQSTASQVVSFSTITASITPSQTPTTNVCIADNLGLAANTATSYLWSPGSETTQTIHPATSGTYTLTTTDAYGCTATDDIEVSLIFPPDQPTTPSGTISRCEGMGMDEYEVDFDAVVNSYTWSISPPEAIINDTDTDPDNDLADYTSNTILISWNPTFSGTATLTISATNSCPTDPTNYVDIIVAPIQTYYADFDGDGLANPMVFTQTCPIPDRYILPDAGFDCDDNVPNP